MRRTHIVHLVCDILQPVLCRLDARDHLSKLRTNDRLRAQRFSERVPLVRPPGREHRQSGTRVHGEQYDILETLLHNEPLRAQTHGKDQPPFVVEVAEDDGHPLTLLAERIRHRYTDLIERHECRPCRRGVRGLDWLGGKLVTSRYEDHSVPALGLASDSKVIRERAVRDPPVRTHPSATDWSPGPENRTFWSQR